MNSLKKFGYSILGTATAIEQSFAAGNPFNDATVDPAKLWIQTNGASGIMATIAKFLGFITLIAVLFVIYAGFQLMTAGGDEEKMKKAKTIIIQVVVGIIIMWLAYSLVNWVMTAFA